MADQTFEFKHVQTGEAIDYTPGSAVAAGQLVQRGGIKGITHLDIAANELGAIEVGQKVYDVVKEEVAFADGAPVYWAAAGNPYGGTAGLGAANATSSGVFIGFAVGAKLTTDPTVRVLFMQSPEAGLASPVAGIADGYKVARGETALDGGNPTPVATGLATVIAFVATLKGSAAPGVGTQKLTADIAGAAGNVNVYGWKPTGAADCTLIASTGTESFYWVAVGT